MVDSLKGLLESSFLQAIDYIQQFFLKIYYIFDQIDISYLEHTPHSIPLGITQNFVLPPSQPVLSPRPGK